MTEPPLRFYAFGSAAVATRCEHTYTITADPTGWTVHWCDDADQPLRPLELGIGDYDTAERFANTHLTTISTPIDHGDTRPVLIAMAQMIAIGGTLAAVVAYLIGG